MTCRMRAYFISLEPHRNNLSYKQTTDDTFFWTLPAVVTERTEASGLSLLNNTQIVSTKYSVKVRDDSHILLELYHRLSSSLIHQVDGLQVVSSLLKRSVNNENFALNVTATSYRHINTAHYFGRWKCRHPLLLKVHRFHLKSNMPIDKQTCRLNMCMFSSTMYTHDREHYFTNLKP